MKKQHPIRKMANDLSRYWLKVTSSGKGTDRAREVAGENAILARHVKPLLDALEEMHGCVYDHAIGGSSNCNECRLLAAWKEPIR